MPGTESGRSGGGGRRGEEEPRRAQHRAPRGGLPLLSVSPPQVSSSGALGIPGASRLGAGVPWSRLRPRSGTEARRGVGCGGRGMRLEVRLVGRGAWKRGGLPCSPAPFRALPHLQSCHFCEPGTPNSCYPLSPPPPAGVKAPGSAPAALLPPPLHLGQRTPPPQPPAPPPARRPAGGSPPAGLFLPGCTLPPPVPCPPCLGRLCS